jgi:ADP-ribose pyrophosphatase
MPKIRSESVVYNGYMKVNRIEIQEGEKIYHRELIRRGHSVCVFIYDSKLRQVLFTEQFRIGSYPSPGPLLECVAGMIDEGESPKKAACRETAEETGLVIEEATLKNVGTFMLSPGVLSEQTTIFLIDTDLSTVNTSKLHGEEHENESILLKLFSYQEALKLFPLEACANPIVPFMARNLWKSELENAGTLY